MDGGMITKEIAAEIWHCYNEIEQARNMIDHMKKSINDKGELEIKDQWGESRNSLQLHIPTNHSNSSFSVKRVSADVALIVLQEHILKEQKELERLMGVCKIQLA
jgi:hypothetical protein